MTVAAERYNRATGRVVWIDVARGIVILLMVLGHTGVPEPVAKFIWSFHMPFFFVISGVFFSSKSDFRIFVKKKAFSLLIPYAIFAVIVLAALYPTEYNDLSQVYNGMEAYALWFIPVLFMAEVIFYPISKLPKTALWISPAAFLCLGYVLSKLSVHLPYKVEVVPFALIFVSLGFIFSREVKDLRQISVIWLLFLVPLNIALSWLLPRLDMCFNIYGYPLANVANAILGTLAMLLIGILICDYKALKGKILKCGGKLVCSYLDWLGRNTLFVVAFSQVLSIYLKKLLIIAHLSPIIEFPLRQVIVLITIYLIAKFFDAHFPYLVGKRPE